MRRQRGLQQNRAPVPAPAAPLAGYSAADIAQLVGLSPARLRTLVRDGLVQPRRGRRGEMRFSFQDLVLLRAARGLLQAHLPARQVHAALRRLRDQRPRGRSLAQVRIAAEGSRVVVRDGGEAWEPVSGQSLIDFEVKDLAREAAPLLRRSVEAAHRHPAAVAADDWLEMAIDLEATDVGEAIRAYRQALALEPENFDAHLNLGRLLHEQGDVAAAERHYRRAEALRPDDPTAAFNLGVALEDRRRLADAAAAYERAIAADPRYADAHFNLSGVLEKLGRKAAALRHLKTYRQLVRGPR